MPEDIEIDLFYELSGLLFDEKVSFIDKQTAIEVGQVGLGRIKPILKFCSPTLKNDRELVFYLVSRNSDNLGEVKAEFRDDDEIVWSAMQKNANAFQYASERLRGNDPMVYYALEHAPGQIQYTLDRFKKNKEFILKFLKTDFEAWEYIDPEIKNDINLLKDFWNHLNEKYYTGEDSKYHLWFFWEHLDDKVKPFFSMVENDYDKIKTLKQMDTAFEKLRLHLELDKELEEESVQSNNTQPKRVKI
jgi:hypothetical protein